MLTGANLHEADLRRAHLHGAALRDADLRRARLAETIFGVARHYSAYIHANLNKANLRKADLSGAYFDEAYLDGANLCKADLTRAVFHKSYLRGTNLTGADLSGADLSGTNLSGTNLSGVNLSEADLHGARLLETVFGDANLRGAQGLDTCEHEGPSTLDHRTLAKSGRLPLAFLRGCGLPDQFIEYLPSLFHQAIQFYSCFISYSTKDQEFADRFHADLQNNGVRCWFSPHKIQGGKKLHEQIDEAIRLYERLLLILSETSMNSAWVKTEIASAREKELVEHRKVLFPIGLVEFSIIQKWKCFDADAGEDLAREIREYFIPDFSNWKNDHEYRQTFDKLLGDLKAQSLPNGPSASTSAEP